MFPKQLRTTVMLATALWPVAVLADIIHVAPCGDDAWTGASAVCMAPDGPKATIQAAIDIAVNGDEIIVAEGTYTGVRNRDIDFLGKAITVRSAAGAAATIIDIAGSAADPARAFHFRSGEDAASVVEGFTIQGGFMNRGGAVLCENSSPMFRDCTFQENTAWTIAADDGGGAVYNFGSSPTLIDCRFLRNYVESTSVLTGGGAMYSHMNSNPILRGCVVVGNWAGTIGAMLVQGGSSITARDCEFRDNAAVGGAVPAQGGAILIVFGSTGEFTDCRFVRNTTAGGCCAGVSVLLDSSASFAGCEFRENSAVGDGGGVVVEHTGATATLVNVLFADNHSTGGRGGGLWVGREAEATVVNCTFSRNSAALGGGGLALRHPGTTVNVSNSVVWDNAFDQIYLLDSILTVSHSNIQGGWPGVGNLDADPLFHDPAAGDFRLLAGSPCIDAGDDGAVPPGITTDLAGLPRFVGAAVDMGAYENQGCYADCDQSGALDFFDFLCFQNLFAAQHPAADCDGSGQLDFFDFLCFQNAFAAGCS